MAADEITTLRKTVAYLTQELERGGHSSKDDAGMRATRDRAESRLDELEAKFERGDSVWILLGQGSHRRREGIVSRQSDDGHTVYVNIGTDTRPEIKVRSPERVWRLP